MVFNAKGLASGHSCRLQPAADGAFTVMVSAFSSENPSLANALIQWIRNERCLTHRIQPVPESGGRD